MTGPLAPKQAKHAEVSANFLRSCICAHVLSLCYSSCDSEKLLRATFRAQARLQIASTGQRELNLFGGAKASVQAALRDRRLADRGPQAQFSWLTASLGLRNARDLVHAPRQAVDLALVKAVRPRTASSWHCHLMLPGCPVAGRRLQEGGKVLPTRRCQDGSYSCSSFFPAYRPYR